MRSANTRARAGKRLPANNFISDSVEDGSDASQAYLPLEELVGKLT
jgi:hypothetical protein